RNIRKLVHTFLIAVYSVDIRLPFSQFSDDTGAEPPQSYYFKIFLHRAFPLHDLSVWTSLILFALSTLDSIRPEQVPPEQKTESRYEHEQSEYEHYRQGQGHCIVDD